ncbi:photosynthetic reaction center cytochrome PufC [Hydrogenophaga sp. T2]|uniref:photosynthetic reaction center cytochrome PufC n=1 Tax=Hydrogenophaga sp. T2 TaxID=3132823 RepID=UPI003CF6CBEF
MSPSLRTLGRRAGVTCLVLVALLLAACERPPIDTVQRGARGTGMVQVYNPRTLAAQIPANQPPADAPAVPAVPGAPLAGAVYQNVKVLGDLDVGNFTRLMVAMTGWVAPEGGCNYCHSNDGNFASDAKYTKVVARRMLQMTQDINANWKSHVAETGVTCYTCHRGQPVPAQVWFTPPADKQAARMAGSSAGQNQPAPQVGLASLPGDALSPYLLQQQPIRVAGTTALPHGNRSSTKQAEHTYSLMMHMSASLGVNCTYCHNSRAFGEWSESTPPRQTAWHGIRMAQSLNTKYLEPLTDTFPIERRGVNGDVAKLNCATCHQGAYKPLYGAPMLKAHPELAGPLGEAMARAAAAGSPVTAAAPAPATPAPQKP